MSSLLLRLLNSVAVSALAIGTTAQCHIVEPSTTPTDTVTYTFAGGGFASFGCAPIDPTFWLSGSGVSVTATFATAMDFPGIRVWGMNDDDIASIEVNGSAYPLDAASAFYTPKVVCGVSPGTEGVAFTAGNLTGVDPANFSYQDVFLNVAGVTSITITGLAGAGWGFDGVLLECSTAVPEQITITDPVYPNPTFDKVHLPLTFHGSAEATILNDLGVIVKEVRTTDGTIDLSGLGAGAYVIIVTQDQARSVHRVVKR